MKKGQTAVFVVLASNSKISKSSITGNVVKEALGNCKDAQVPYDITEEYIDKEPYQDTEYYTEYLDAEVISRYTERKFNLDNGFYAYSKLELRNTDDEAGWFTVTFRWNTLKDKITDKDVRHYIEPDEISSFEDIYNIDSGEDYSVTHAFESDIIEKSRQVTKYRDVTKTRTVTKYRTERQCD